MGGFNATPKGKPAFEDSLTLRHPLCIMSSLVNTPDSPHELLRKYHEDLRLHEGVEKTITSESLSICSRTFKRFAPMCRRTAIPILDSCWVGSLDFNFGKSRRCPPTPQQVKSFLHGGRWRKRLPSNQGDGEQEVHRQALLHFHRQGRHLRDLRLLREPGRRMLFSNEASWGFQGVTRRFVYRGTCVFWLSQSSLRCLVNITKRPIYPEPRFNPTSGLGMLFHSGPTPFYDRVWNLNVFFAGSIS